MQKIFYRYMLQRIADAFQKKKAQIVILIGPRQVGKTHIIKNFIANHNLRLQQAIYLNMERPDDMEACQDIHHLKNYLQQKNISSKQSVLLVIDEFQYIKNATKLFKLLYDEYKNIYILATGSSSIDIQKHMQESLAGRKKILYAEPLSFEEHVLATKPKSDLFAIPYRLILPSQVHAATVILFDYLAFGGYPRLADLYKLDNESKKEEIKEIYTSYIQKDIKALIGGENMVAYNNLLKLLASQTGNLLNIQELSTTLHMKRYDVERYLHILEHTYIIRLIYPFHANKRKELTKMPKVYFNDLGILHMASANFSPLDKRQNIGAIIENFVLNQLMFFVSATDQIYFWRTAEGAEVDFIWKRDGEIIPIEVKWSEFATTSIPVRLMNFCRFREDVKSALIITKSFIGSKKDGKTLYHFVPASMFIHWLRELKK